MKIYLIVIIAFILCMSNSFAQSLPTDTEKFLDSIRVDLPEAELSCRVSGSLSKVFTEKMKFKSGGNAFLVDKENKELALFEKAVLVNSDEENKTTTANLFIKVPNVKRQILTELLVKKHLVISTDAQVIYVIRIEKNNEKETYIFDGKDENGDEIGSTLFTQIRKLKTILYNGKKFFTADGNVKIRLPEPPKKITASGKAINVFENVPAVLNCYCTGCPIHDFDLTDLKDAFDTKLVEDITKEATGLK